jgi:hypothetical protein
VWQINSDYLNALEDGGLSTTLRCVCVGPLGSNTLSVVNDNVAVQATFNSTMGRTAALVVERATIDAGLLNVLTDHVWIYVGLQGYPEIPMGYFRILDRTDTQDGHVAVRLIDVTQDLANHDFTTAWSTIVGATYASEIRRIVRDASPTINIDVSGVSAANVPSLTWTADHAQPLNDLTAAINCTWQADRVGDLIAYLSPYAITPAPAPSLILTNGVGGVQVKMSHTISSANTRNAVTVIVTNQDGSVDQRVFIYDNDPNSKTFYGGPLGFRNKTYRVQSLPSGITAQDLALRLLRQLLASSETWQVEVPFLPHIDQGDVIQLQYQGAYYVVIVETINYSLSARNTTSLTCRRYRLSDTTTIGAIL